MNSTFRRLLLNLHIVLISLVCQPAWAETIQLKSGNIIHAPIVERTHDHIKVDVSGVMLTYDQDQILNITPEGSLPAPVTQPPSRSPAQDSSDIIEKVSQSIVVIDSVKDQGSTEGTGFFVSADGLIATNLHVIFKGKYIKVQTRTGKSYPVQYIANYDDDRDICLIKIDISDAPALPLGDSSNLKKGQMLFTIGHREGARYEYSSGSFVSKKMIDGEENLQTHIVTGHGNSGGPILNEKGELVGISTLFTADGYNFSTPVHIAKNFFNFNALITIADLNNKVSGAYELTFYANGTYLEGKFGEALGKYKQALAFDPNYLKAWIGSAKCYTQMGMDTEAFGAWQEVLKRAPDNAQANLRLGKIYLDRNMTDDAITCLQKAVNLEPQDSAVYSDLAFAYGQKKMYNEAINAYKKAVEIDPKNASAFYNLSVAYYNSQDFSSAKKYCEQAQRLGYAVPDTFLMQLSQSQGFHNPFDLK